MIPRLTLSGCMNRPLGHIMCVQQMHNLSHGSWIFMLFWWPIEMNLVRLFWNITLSIFIKVLLETASQNLFLSLNERFLKNKQKWLHKEEDMTTLMTFWTFCLIVIVVIWMVILVWVMKWYWQWLGVWIWGWMSIIWWWCRWCRS